MRMGRAYRRTVWSAATGGTQGSPWPRYLQRESHHGAKHEPPRFALTDRVHGHLRVGRPHSDKQAERHQSPGPSRSGVHQQASRSQFDSTGHQDEFVLARQWSGHHRAEQPGPSEVQSAGASQ
jgi:hypothetical protein